MGHELDGAVEARHRHPLGVEVAGLVPGDDHPSTLISMSTTWSSPSARAR
jgi:hypothetical protein